VSCSDNISYLLINIDDYEKREYDPLNFRHFYFYDSYYIFINLMVFIYIFTLFIVGLSKYFAEKVRTKLWNDGHRLYNINLW
jgi:hypothetical protein